MAQDIKIKVKREVVETAEETTPREIGVDLANGRAESLKTNIFHCHKCKTFSVILIEET